MNNCAVRGNQRAYPVFEVFPIFPDVFVAVGIGESALAVAPAVLPFPYVFGPVGPGVGALAVETVVLPFPDVFVPVGPGVGAEAVVPNHVLIFETWGKCLGKGSAWKAQQPDGGKSYENKGSDPLHTGTLTEYVGSGESEGGVLLNTLCSS
jgi:hypothetical protein